MKYEVNKIPIYRIRTGRRIIYHIGYLPHDRRKSKVVSKRADKFLHSSDGTYLMEFACNSGKQRVDGTGEFELSQLKLGEFKYVYYARRKYVKRD